MPPKALLHRSRSGQRPIAMYEPSLRHRPGIDQPSRAHLGEWLPRRQRLGYLIRYNPHRECEATGSSESRPKHLLKFGCWRNVRANRGPVEPNKRKPGEMEDQNAGHEGRLRARQKRPLPRSLGHNRPIRQAVDGSAPSEHDCQRGDEEQEEVVLGTSRRRWTAPNQRAIVAGERADRDRVARPGR